MDASFDALTAFSHEVDLEPPIRVRSTSQGALVRDDRLDNRELAEWCVFAALTAVPFLFLIESLERFG